MLVPAGVPHLPVLFSATAALALLWPAGACAAETSDTIQQAIQTGLPHYDPTVYEKASAEKAARSIPRNLPLPGNPAEHGVPGTNTGPAAVPPGKADTSRAGSSQQQEAGNGATTSAQSGENAYELPKITVHPDYEISRPLPRIEPPPPPLKDLQGEPLESDSARDDRLIKKHLPFLTQLFNSRSVQIALAREAEAAELKTAQMNELAAGIEIQAALGRDPAEVKKLRAEYLKLYYSGPK